MAFSSGHAESPLTGLQSKPKLIGTRPDYGLYPTYAQAAHIAAWESHHQHRSVYEDAMRRLPQSLPPLARLAATTFKGGQKLNVTERWLQKLAGEMHFGTPATRQRAHLSAVGMVGTSAATFLADDLDLFYAHLYLRIAHDVLTDFTAIEKWSLDQIEHLFATHAHMHPHSAPHITALLMHANILQTPGGPDGGVTGQRFSFVPVQH